jgi:hypothetical protein
VSGLIAIFQQVVYSIPHGQKGEAGIAVQQLTPKQAQYIDGAPVYLLLADRAGMRP